MVYIKRTIHDILHAIIKRDKSVLLLGPRQTGKTTLIHNFTSDLYMSFVRPDIRQRYEKNPVILAGEIEALNKKKKKSKLPLVLLDEVQKVPAILDVIQDLIDKRKAKFVLTGSSARKLKRGHDVNLLPGRLVSLRLSPFTYNEFPHSKLDDLLIYGSLPGIALTENPKDKEMDLQSYVITYLEEEVRAEAIVRNIGSFGRFLELAASESGQIINLRKLSQEIGVAHTTISSYYEILEDCLIISRIEPITVSKTRKKLSKGSKFLFFDLGVRRVAAREGIRLHRAQMGSLFEQFVGLELMRLASYSDQAVKIKFWRDHDGPEVDWVIDKEKHFTPVEVKLTDAPRSGDIRHLEFFLSEYDNSKEGYLVCRIPRKIKLSKRVTAIPWQELKILFSGK